MVDELTAAIEAGVALDFTRDPERPVLRYPRSAEDRVRALLDDPRRAELRRILTLAAGYRRALLHAEPEVERLAGDLGPALAKAVRRTLPSDASPSMTRGDAFSRYEFIRARGIGTSGNTRQDASSTPMRHPWVALDFETLRDVLGPDAADPHAVACLRFDILVALREIEAGILTGQLPPRRLVRGKPLALWLGMQQLAQLLGAWDTRPRRQT